MEDADGSPHMLRFRPMLIPAGHKMKARDSIRTVSFHLIKTRRRCHRRRSAWLGTILSFVGGSLNAISMRREEGHKCGDHLKRDLTIPAVRRPLTTAPMRALPIVLVPA